MFIFIYGFVKLLKAFDRRGILSTLTRDVHVRPIKTNSKAITIAKETTNNKYKKYNSMKQLQGQQFSFTKTRTESKVSLVFTHISINPFQI